MIKAILWDLDGTLMDFKISEKTSLKRTFVHYGLPECDDETVEVYSKINQGYWEKLERGEVTKEQVLRCRFEDFLSLQNIDIPATEFCKQYEAGLADVVVYIDDSFQVIERLKYDGYIQLAVTNGAKSVQRRKLKNSGFDNLFDDIFISDEVGYEKPTKGFFDAVLDSLPNISKDEIIIVGDSLTSDIKGGNNVGIKTCWYNPSKKALPQEYKVNYEIDNLAKIFEILEGEK